MNIEDAVARLKSIDTQALDELDPSRSENHVIRTEMDVPMTVEVMGQESDLSSNEVMRVKVLVQGAQNDCDPNNIKIEITSQKDIFFYYITK